MHRFWRPAVLALTLAAPLSLALAQKKQDGKYSHPHLVAADRLCAQAFVKLEAAEKNNEYDAGGHAAKAKLLLAQAQAELALATAKK